MVLSHPIFFREDPMYSASRALLSQLPKRTGHIVKETVGRAMSSAPVPLSKADYRDMGIRHTVLYAMVRLPKVMGGAEQLLRHVSPESPLMYRGVSRLMNPVMSLFALDTDLSRSFEKACEIQAKTGACVIFDYAQEYSATEAERDQTFEHYRRSIEQAPEDIQAYALKYSGLVCTDALAKAETPEPLSDDEFHNLCRGFDRVLDLCKLAASKDKTIFVDAEGFAEEDAIFYHATRTLMPQFNKEKAVINPTFQMYRNDSEERLGQLISFQESQARTGAEFVLGAKLVCGAYYKTDQPQYPYSFFGSIQETHSSYERALSKAIETPGLMTTAATHNPQLMDKAVQLATQFKANDRLALGQLYGMETGFQNFSGKTYLYGVWGPVLPYFIRRLKEHSESPLLLRRFEASQTQIEENGGLGAVFKKGFF
jgi:proline dehydrogenase